MTGTEAGPTGLMVGPVSLPATFKSGYTVFPENGYVLSRWIVQLALQMLL